MKNLFLALFCFLPFYLSAQNERVELTKQQMYEDFDVFYNIIKDVNPQLVARKKITGVDILVEIKKTRKNIDTISQASFFTQLLAINLSLCNDMHNRTVIDKKNVSDLLSNDTVKLQKLKTLLKQTDDDIQQLLFKSHFSYPFYLDYYKGDYYSIGRAVISTNGVADSIPKGAKILSIAGFSVDSLLSLNPNIICRWDNILQKKYSVIFAGEMLVPVSDSIVIEFEKNKIKNRIIYRNGVSVPSNSNGKYFSYENSSGYVDYFSENELLYIRLPQMLNDEFYLKEIYEKGKNQHLKKVVIDIRQNGGGSDYVWFNILCSIIKNPLDIRATIGCRNTKKAFKTLEINKETDASKIVKMPLLNNEKFRTFTWGKMLEPSDSTLGFDGKIYILQDRMIFSSAGALSNVARMADNIVSVGETTGYLLGFGIAPLFFSLPNSYFCFQLEPVLDLSNISSVSDFYHDFVEIPVEISVEQRMKYFDNFNSNQQKGIYSKEFLFNHDPVFQKVLEFE